ncbi:hypothetical protein A3860_21255 [Niastella vici]|uniref:FecR family protein n=1 Tax=Niastella vici TaxID=1703345 RepID=A0A1V9G060_9BACT|nr:FecR domain-containing protein [Niastella vici]OQP63954.1 hypothetical protein A3860_21255 [Niastella vici]
MKESSLDELIYIAGLIKKSQLNELSAVEAIQLENWKNRKEANREFAEQINAGDRFANDMLALEQYDTTAAEQRFFSITGMPFIDGEKRVAPLVNIFRRKAIRWAAAAIILFTVAGSTWYIMKSSRSVKQPVAVSQNVKIVPGGNKAILTRSDGSQVILDSAANGLISREGNAMVIKLKDGKLAYNASAAADEARPIYNTVSTPRGGQYQITLPDGTGVWLNSASSITFPTQFSGNERKVKITGEAYFEVTSHLSKGIKTKFIVDAEGTSITVLGTHFNVNAYTDEEAIKATLIEGSIKVNKGGLTTMIKPGEQFRYSNGATNYEVLRPDLEEVLAWKNGKFIFRNTGAITILRQISRWYDVDIHYKGALSGIMFSGGISRKDNIEKLLELLQLDERIRFEIKGREITVSPK